MPKQFDRLLERGRWHQLAIALFVVLFAVTAAPSMAQRVAPIEVVPVRPGPPVAPPGSLPLEPPKLTPQTMPITPQVVVPVTPQAVAPAPAVPAPIIRLRCEVAPDETTCREPPPPDGGDSDTCDCARDLCYNDGNGTRVCEKAAN